MAYNSLHEAIPLHDFSDQQEQRRSSDEEQGPRVGLRRARTDVHVRYRNSQDSGRYHSYAGPQHRRYFPPHSGYGGEVLSSHTAHYGSDQRPTAWYNTVMARRRRGETPGNDQETVDELANAMEGDEKLMSDDVDGEIMRKETLRELSKPLRVKKEIRRLLTAHRQAQPDTRHISAFKQLKYSLSMHWYKTKQSIKDTFHDYSLWHKDLKEIEGTFGTSVGSYFRFLRYLFLLNVVIAVLVCGFLLTPQLLARLHGAEMGQPTEAPPTLSPATTATSGLTPSALYVDDLATSTNIAEISPLLITSDNNSITKSVHYEDTFGPLDWLTGAGWFDTTELYYGTYLSVEFSLVADQYYNMPAAYFLVIFISFIIYLVVVLHRVIVLYKNNYIDSEHDMPATFVKKVFSSWDFSITEKKAATIKHRSIYNELKELLHEYLSEESEEGWLEWLWSWTVKLVMWLLILGLLALLGWVMYLMLDYGLSDEVGQVQNDLGLLVYPLIVTCVITFVPSIFALVVKLERYKNPRHSLYTTLLRTILMELTILGVLIGFWFNTAIDPESVANNNTTSTMASTSLPSSTDVSTTNDKSAVGSDECWETSLGEEFYRLLIIDFLFTLVMHIVIIVISFICSGKEVGVCGQYWLEFDISHSTLHLIYNQTLLWAGFFFCPLTPLIVLLKGIIMFYLQKFLVLKFLQPNDQPWRAAQTETVFFALTLVSLLLCFLAYGFILVKGNASDSCGPFQGYQHYIDYVTSVAASDQTTVQKIVGFFMRPGVVTFILIILAIMVYCAKSVAEGRAEMIQLLRQQLELEMRDRAFLLQLTEKVRRGEYRPASPEHIRAASPPPRQRDNLTQRSSFVFAENKAALSADFWEDEPSTSRPKFYIDPVHPTDDEPQARYFSDYADDHNMEGSHL